MHLFLLSPTIYQLQLPPDEEWLLRGILLLCMFTLISLFLIYKIKQDQEKQSVIAERDNIREVTEKLCRLSDSMSWSQPIEKFLLNNIKPIKEITNAHRVLFYLFDTRREFLRGIADSEDLRLFSGIDLLPKSAGRFPILFDNLELIIIEDLLNPHPKDEVLPSELINDGNRAAIVIPLHVEHDVFGCLVLFFDRYVEWTNNKADFFLSIGRMLGKNIKNAKISENQRELALLRERKRLSQELHDNFSQLISALRMRVEAARLSYEEGSQEKLGIDLDRIITTAHEIQGSLREEMVALRTSINEQEDLLPSVRACVERFQQFSNISVIFEDQGVPDSVYVPSRVGFQLMRILHESLSNIRRHSKATQVVIRLEEGKHRLCMEIEDNGQGFLPKAIPEDRLGLQIMRERAQEVGGNITIRSAIGSGTFVQVELPEFQVEGLENES